MRSKTTAQRNLRKTALLRFLKFITALLVAALVLGFIIFTATVSRLQTPASMSKADGIVVWTGKGGDRVQTGLQLLKTGKGERLLISGTNPDLSRDTILESFDVRDEMAACCVDMDTASNTIENAQQTANWARALDYNHIILVTSAYHMPRAEIEIGSTAGRLAITPYPVRADNSKPWWRDGAQFKRLLQEYGKLLLSSARNNHARGTPTQNPSADK